MINENNVLSYFYWHLNKAELNSLDDDIMMYLLENHKEIPFTSLRTFVKDCYFSQSAVSKFLSRNHLTWHELQRMVALNEQKLSLYFENLRPTVKGPDAEQIAEEIIEKQKANIEMLKSIDFRHAGRMAEKLLKARRVFIMGSDFSMAIVNLLQGTLIQLGKVCYTLYDPVGQMNVSEKLKKDDLVICISIKQRWFDNNYDAVQKIFASGCSTVLWTIKRDHKDTDRFNDVFFFGSPVNELGYTQLECFNIFMVHLLLEKAAS